jgi:hypothetical protein
VESGAGITGFDPVSALAVSTGVAWTGATLDGVCLSFAGPVEGLLAGEFWANTGEMGSNKRMAAANRGVNFDIFRFLFIMRRFS